MATIRLIPSTLVNAAGTTYLTVSDTNNAFTNTDSDTYATITNIHASTSSRYVYLRGFNFDDVPNNAIVDGFTIKIKARESGISTSSSYSPRVHSGAGVISGIFSPIGTSVSVLTCTDLEADWDTIKSYGSNFGIRINCRRNSKNTTGYMYIYGAEIEVDYTMPVSATVTSTLSGNGTISPSGAYSCDEGDEYTLTITPTNASDTVTATKNGTDITSQLVAHGAGSGIDHYTYTFTVDGDATIAVVIGGSTEQPKLYVKLNGTWVEATPYKKVNGSWVLQSDVTTVFQSGVNYLKG